MWSFSSAESAANIATESCTPVAGSLPLPFRNWIAAALMCLFQLHSTDHRSLQWGLLLLLTRAELGRERRVGAHMCVCELKIDILNHSFIVRFVG